MTMKLNNLACPTLLALNVTLQSLFYYYTWVRIIFLRYPCVICHCRTNRTENGARLHYLMAYVLITEI